MSRRGAVIRSLALSAGLLMGLPAVACAEDRAPGSSKTVEISFRTHDGCPLFGKRTVPTTKGPHPVVIDVRGPQGHPRLHRGPDSAALIAVPAGLSNPRGESR